MNGCVIADTPIAVDFWQIRQKTHLKIFFLSHMHSDHTKGLSGSWRKPIYCSPVTARLLPAKLKVPVSLIKPLEVEESHIIPLDETGQETMTVSLIDANHCPGAVMFLFEGYFGRILYTGDFRYQPSMITDTILSSCGQVDKLYLDNTYNNPKCIWPNRSECAAKIIDIISQYPAYEIVIGTHKLGKEELLVGIALTLKMRIVVNPDRLKTMKILELPDVFTTDSTQSRIRTIPQHLVTRKNLAKWREGAPTIAILPTALYTSLDMEPYAGHPDFHVVPYSDHSSYSELIEFVSHVKPKSIIPVVGGGGTFDMGNGDMSVYDPFLTRNTSGENGVIIPDSVLKFMNSSSTLCRLVKNTTENNTQVKHRKPATLRKNSAKDLPKGVVFSDSIDEDLTEELKRRKECEQHRNAANLSQDSQSDQEMSMQSTSHDDEGLTNVGGTSGDSKSQRSNQMSEPFCGTTIKSKVIHVDVHKEASGLPVLQPRENCTRGVDADVPPPTKKPKLDVYAMLLASASKRKKSKESTHDKDAVICLQMPELKSSNANDPCSNQSSQKPSSNVPSSSKEDEPLDNLTLIRSNDDQPKDGKKLRTSRQSKQTHDERSQVWISYADSPPEIECRETSDKKCVQSGGKVVVSNTVKASNIKSGLRNSVSTSGFLNLPYIVRRVSKKRKKMDPAQIFKHFLQK